MKVLKYMQMATIVAALGFDSCKSDDIPQIGDADIQIIASIGDVKTRVNSEDDGSKFLPGDTLYIRGNKTGAAINVKTVPYITKNGTIDGVAEFQPVLEKLCWRDYNKQTFIAYNSGRLNFLYNFDNSGSYDYLAINYGDYEIASDQTTVEKLRAEDIILGFYRRLDYFSTNGVVSFNMKHIFSKVTVTIKEYSGFDNPGKDGFEIKNVVINSNELKNDYYLYYMDEDENFAKYKGWGVRTPSANKISISPLKKEDKTNGKHSFTAIIAPYPYATGEVFMSFEFQGVTYKVLANSDLCSQDFLQEGKHYHFELTINKKASVNMSKVSLIGWEEEEFTKFG